MVRVDQFAFQIRATKDLPVALRNSYEKASAKEVWSYVIYAPPIVDPPARHRQMPAGYLLMVGRDRLRIAVERDVVEELDLPFTDLISIEIGEALLFSWMRLIFGRRTYREIKIPFNTVSIELFRRALFLARRALDVKFDGACDSHVNRSTLPFKFQSELQRWLFEDEKMLELAFQPEIRARRFIMITQLAPPTLLALTDRQFLCITEEPPIARERLGKYSSVYVYCPLPRLDSLALEADRERRGLADLGIDLVNDRARFRLSVKISGDDLARFALFCRRTMEALNKSASEGR
ncbi:hypothetical protein [Pyrinomonas sp.]|uniref:hypothetical protein n=1 Tax=Pyrinomonas sp. TaxID=2080306 RepID=UPI00333158BB